MITVVGEALVDLVLEPGSDEPRAHPGGSPANVAVGLARLGQEVVLATRLGRDDYGALVHDHLAGNGVKLAPGWESEHPTSRATARLDERGAATYEFDITWDLPTFDLAPGTDCLHTGSLALTLEPGSREVFALMKRAGKQGALVSYDPNVRPALVDDVEAARRWVEEVASLAHVVKASEEDLEFLYPGEDHEDLAREWLAGPTTSLVVVTRGGDGVYGATRLEQLELPPPKVDLVDTVGAGDAFTAGLLDALERRSLLTVGRVPALRRLHDDELGDVLRDAMLVAALTVARPGADPPTRAEVDAARH